MTRQDGLILGLALLLGLLGAALARAGYGTTDAPWPVRPIATQNQSATTAAD